jgi:hypothetical protein
MKEFFQENQGLAASFALRFTKVMFLDKDEPDEPA